MVIAKSDKPLVSVVMPLYNAERYLAETLDSISKQKLKDFEIIMVDDGSEDGTADIAASYVSKDKRFRLIKQSNSGAAAARNRGMDEARADYLLFLDADDLFDSQLLERLYLTAVRSTADVCICDADGFCSADGTRVSYIGAIGDIDAGTYKTSELSNNLFQLFSSAPWNKLIRKELVSSHNLRYQNLKKVNDAYFIYSALAYSTSISVIRKKMVHYRYGLGDSIQDNHGSNNECAFLAAEKLHNLQIMNGALNNSLNCWCLKNYIYALSKASLGSYSSAKQIFDLYNNTYRQKWNMDAVVFPKKTELSLKYKWWCIKYLSFDELYEFYHSQSDARYLSKSQKAIQALKLLMLGLTSRLSRGRNE